MKDIFMRTNTIFTLIKEYFLIGLGTFILAFGLHFFFFQNKIASGGVTGLALVVNSIFHISTGFFVAVSNFILFTLAFIVISGQFGIKSIYATVILSVFLSYFEKFYPNKAKWIKDFWMPNKEWEGCDVDDPSARVLKNYGDSGK